MVCASDCESISPFFLHQPHQERQQLELLSRGGGDSLGEGGGGASWSPGQHPQHNTTMDPPTAQGFAIGRPKAPALPHHPFPSTLSIIDAADGSGAVTGDHASSKCLKSATGVPPVLTPLQRSQQRPFQVRSCLLLPLFMQSNIHHSRFSINLRHHLILC